MDLILEEAKVTEYDGVQNQDSPSRRSRRRGTSRLKSGVSFLHQPAGRDLLDV